MSTYDDGMKELERLLEEAKASSKARAALEVEIPPEEAPMEAEILTEEEAPMEAEILTEEEAPMEAEILPEEEAPMEAEILPEEEAPMEADILVEEEAPMEAEILVEEAPMEAEIPTEAEAPNAAAAAANAGTEDAEEVDADELAMDVAMRMAAINRDLSLVADVFLDLEPAQRVMLLKQLRYANDMVAYLERLE